MKKTIWKSILCAGAAAGRSGAAAGDAGIALRGFMYPAIGGALSRLSVAAALAEGYGFRGLR